MIAFEHPEAHGGPGGFGEAPAKGLDIDAGRVALVLGPQHQQGRHSVQVDQPLLCSSETKVETTM